MSSSGLQERHVVGVVVAVFALLLVGQLVGYPVGLAYVDSGSMEPTLSTGDAFIAVPSVLTGSPEAGDIVTYEATELDGGGLTTHRIYAVEDDHYITRGDANVFTDQEAGEPPVTDDQIVAQPLTVGELLFRIPSLGALVSGLQMALAGGVNTVVGWFGLSEIVGPGHIRVGLIVGGLGLLAWSVLFE